MVDEKVRREKALAFSGCNSPPANWFAPPVAIDSGCVGNEALAGIVNASRGRPDFSSHLISSASFLIDGRSKICPSECCSDTYELRLGSMEKQDGSE